MVIEAKNKATSNHAKGKAARERLIRSAARLFIENGYHATGIKDIINHAEVSKGSFYFYFESKRDLALEVHRYFNGRTLDVLCPLAQRHGWSDFVDHLLDWVHAKTLCNKNFGCPFAVLGTETAFTDPDLSALYYQSILDGVSLFKQAMLNTGFNEAEAVDKSERAFSLYEGYMLRYRLSGSVEELEKMRAALKAT